MVIQDGLFLLLCFLIFIDQLSDGEMMPFKVRIQGVDLSIWSLIITESLCVISDLSSSFQIFVPKRVIITLQIPLNFLTKDNFVALSDISMTALLHESKMQVTTL